MPPSRVRSRFGRFPDLTATVFGRLTVVTYDGHYKWLCRCDCGADCVVAGSDLRRGHSQSCGCLLKEIATDSNTTHGKSETRTYTIWRSMKQRCHDTNYHAYDNYGGRGVIVCQAWRESYQQFLTDMGEAPDGLSIDRIDNSGGYSPANCRWATPKEQQRNRRDNNMVEFRGERRCLAEWAELFGIGPQTLGSRLKRKVMTTEEAMTTPARKYHSAGRLAEKKERRRL